MVDQRRLHRRKINRTIPLSEKIIKSFHSFLKYKNGTIDNLTYYECIIEAVKNQNSSCFQMTLDKFFASITNSKILTNTGIYYGGVHYISRSLGKWFRFNLNKRESISDYLNRIGFLTLTSLYDKLPSEYHLCTWNGIKKDIKILFDDVDSELLKNGIIKIKLSSIQWILDVLGEIENTSDFLLGSLPRFNKNNKRKDRIRSEIKNELGVFIKGIDGDVEQEEKRLDYFRQFVMTFFYGLYGMSNGIVKKKSAIVLPFHSCLMEAENLNYPYLRLYSGAECYNYGAFAAYFNNGELPSSDILNELRLGFGTIVCKLVAMEREAVSDKIL
ncbi:hypothetical protein KKC87_04575, partial [Patescibacteria group bacterium]|nr:hypothetical protein [Patescibacteria group bacterium]